MDEELVCAIHDDGFDDDEGNEPAFAPGIPGKAADDSGDDHDEGHENAAGADVALFLGGFCQRQPISDQTGYEREGGEEDQGGQSHRQRHPGMLDEAHDRGLKEKDREGEKAEHRLAGTVEEREPVGQRGHVEDGGGMPVLGALEKHHHLQWHDANEAGCDGLHPGEIDA